MTTRDDALVIESASGNGNGAELFKLSPSTSELVLQLQAAARAHRRSFRVSGANRVGSVDDVAVHEWQMV